MRVYYGVLGVLFLWCVSSCQRELSSQYYYNFESTSVVLAFDTTSSIFSSNYYTDMRNLSLSGTYLVEKNQLILIPYVGSHGKISPREGSIVTIRVYDADSGYPYTIFNIKNMEGAWVGTTTEYVYETDNAMAEKGLIICTGFTEPYLFKSAGPGDYRIFLFSNNYNKNILRYRIKRKKLISADGIVFIDEQ